uniref:Uncharacterized protein n=1 Tax=viral metagenome TaxID=1070528 RepID=A0A6H1ZTA3_9ZZZZ
MTETYTAITPDGEATSIDQVQVRRVTEVQKDWGIERSADILTLGSINTRLQVIRGQIQTLQAEEADLLATKFCVEEMAAKVVLKAPEVPA